MIKKQAKKKKILKNNKEHFKQFRSKDGIARTFVTKREKKKEKSFVLGVIGSASSERM